MKTFFYVLMVVVLVAATGCGGDKERGLNSPDKKRDLPRAAPTEANK